MDIATKEPTQIIIGDTLQWNRQDLTDYPASEWTLVYTLRGPKAITITAVADGDNYSVVEAASVTAAYESGTYWWTANVTKGTERFTVSTGQFELIENIAVTEGTYDNRSHAKIVLDNIEPVIEGRATKDQLKYLIAGRSLEKTPINELLELREKYRLEYNAELRKEKIANGEKPGLKVRTRFTK